METKKGLIDQVIMVLTKSDFTDESRLDEDYISAKLDQIRVDEIVKWYKRTRVIDSTWVQRLGKIAFHKVNFADDVNLVYAVANISKATLPQLVSLEAGGGNQELGLTLISTCGTKQYSKFPMSQWGNIPPEHERALFNYFDRINTEVYVNKVVSELVGVGVLSSPEDAKLIQSDPVLTGSITASTVYLVKYGQVIYNGAAYQDGDTFTGVSLKTNYKGTGTVYLNSQARAFRSSDAYPVTSDMARTMILRLLVEEYGIEMKVIPDSRNDSKDDAQKVQI